MRSTLVLAAKPIAVFALTLGITFSFVLLNQQNPSPIKSERMAENFILWLHGLGDSGPANVPLKDFFESPEFVNVEWAFPSAPANPVTCNNGVVMNSWFDIHEIPITASSPKDEDGVLKAVQGAHAIIDKKINAGIDPKNVFVCGFSQGGTLALASVLLYPKTLGGCVVFSGWVPFNDSSIIERITPEAKKTPIFWMHGKSDRTVLIEAGQAGPPFLEKIGSNCEFKEYPMLSHSINHDEYNSFEEWIKSRLRISP